MIFPSLSRFFFLSFRSFDRPRPRPLPRPPSRPTRSDSGTTSGLDFDSSFRRLSSLQFSAVLSTSSRGGPRGPLLSSRGPLSSRRSSLRSFSSRLLSLLSRFGDFASRSSICRSLVAVSTGRAPPNMEFVGVLLLSPSSTVLGAKLSFGLSFGGPSGTISGAFRSGGGPSLLQFPPSSPNRSSRCPRRSSRKPPRGPSRSYPPRGSRSSRSKPLGPLSS